MRKYRLLYLAEVIAVTIVMFKVPYMARSEESGEIIRDVSSIFLAWSCAVTAIGFAKQYFNKNSPLRKLANEAIYPFYLLHQPVIVITGYFTIQLDVAVAWKVIIVLLSSFTLTTSIYWFLIRPFNLTRIIFGMKKTEKTKKDPGISNALEPVTVKNEMSLSA